MVVNYIFPLTWLVLFSLFLTQMLKLREELQIYRPIPLTPSEVHPSLYKNIYDFITLPKISSLHLIMFTMPRCSHCHSNLEILLDLFKEQGRIPVTLILQKEHKDIDSFIEKYSRHFTTAIFNKEELMALNIQMYPTFMLIDKQGEISEVLPPDAEMAYVIYQKAINKKNENYRGNLS